MIIINRITWLSCILFRIAEKNLKANILYKILFAEIPIQLRGASFYEDLLHESEKLEYKSTFLVDETLKHKYGSGLSIIVSKITNQAIVKVKNAWVGMDGSVIENNRLHNGSSLYSRINIKRLLRISHSFFYRTAGITLEKASIVSQQLVDQGTYGDYVLEILIPIVAARASIVPPILIEKNYATKFMLNDLNVLGVSYQIIPCEGMHVNELTVIGPAQIYDNFTSDNILKIRKAFPVLTYSKDNVKTKIYISRVGLSRDENKRERIIINEGEIEEYLISIGFEVIRAHLLSNTEMRNKISQASIVIGSHGSGLMNLIWGNPNTVIELASEECWGCCFIKIAHAIGVDKYTVIKTTNGMILIDELQVAVLTHTN